MKHGWRIFAYALILAIILPIGALIVFLSTLNPNNYKPEIVAAVDKATGRELVLNGPITATFSLWPDLVAKNVELSNFSGGAAPYMLKLGTVSARVSLLGLLTGHIDIKTLFLDKPQLFLEKNAQGAENWDFAQNVAGSPVMPITVTVSTQAGSSAEVSKPSGRHIRIDIQDVEIKDATVSYLNRVSGRNYKILLPFIAFKTADDGNISEIRVLADYKQVPIEISGQTGPLSEILEPAGYDGPWNMALTFKAAGAEATLTGDIADPATLQGYHLQLHAVIPNLSATAPLFGIKSLPPIADITAEASLYDGGNSGLQWGSFEVAAGSSDLSDLMPGLILNNLQISVPNVAVGINGTASFSLNGQPLTLQATLPSLQVLLNRQGSGPVSVQLNGLNGLNLSLFGVTGAPFMSSQTSLTLTGDIPDLKEVGRYLNRPYRSFGPITLHADLTAHGEPYGMVTHDLLFSAPGISLSGNIDVSQNNRLSAENTAPEIPPLTVSGTLSGNLAGADLLRKALNLSAKPLLTPLEKLLLSLKAGGVTLPAQAPAKKTPPTEAAGELNFISDRKIPYQWLHKTDLNLQLNLNQVVLFGTDYRNLQGQWQIRHGIMSVANGQVLVPGGYVHFAFRVTPPAWQKLTAKTPVILNSVSLVSVPVVTEVRTPGEIEGSFSAPSLLLAPLIRAYGMTGAYAKGNISFYGNFRAEGATLREAAKSLTGDLGIVALHAEIRHFTPPPVLNKILGLIKATVPGLPEGNLTADCLASRISGEQGLFKIGAFVLSAPEWFLTAEGNFNFPDGTQDIVLTPHLPVNGQTLGVPVLIKGSLTDPDFLAEPLQTVSKILTVLQEFAPDQVSTQSQGAYLCRAALPYAGLGDKIYRIGAGARAAGQALFQTKSEKNGPVNLLNQFLQ